MFAKEIDHESDQSVRAFIGAVISSQHYLDTGQRTCHAEDGREIACTGSGQDAAFAVGTPWPEPRFESRDDEVVDSLTGLIWCRSANLAEFPLTWQEALDFVAAMNREQRFGQRDWRMPNRRELRGLLSLQTKLPALPEAHPVADLNHEGAGSAWRLPTINELEALVDCAAHSPALPSGHPFAEVQDIYWSSTTSLFEPDWAWALYLEQGATGIGQKCFARFAVWAVATFD